MSVEKYKKGLASLKYLMDNGIISFEYLYSPGEGASYWDEVCKTKVMVLGKEIYYARI